MKRLQSSAVILALSGAAFVLAAPVPAWTPNPAQASRLSPSVNMDGFQAQVPKGYTEQIMGDGADKGYFWSGPLPAAGHPLILIFSKEAAGPKAEARPLVQTFARVMAAHARHYTGWHVSPVQSGTIHGVSFVRCDWSGTRADSSMKEQGFLYLGRQGRLFFNLSAQKSGAADKAGLALAEASVLTFRAN